jgi:hypothetical protein
MKLEEKIRIFGHYLFCLVKYDQVIITMQSIDGNTGCVMSIGPTAQFPVEECKLQLKELKSITHKDALRCAGLANLPEALVKNWQIKNTCYGETVFTFPDEETNYRNMIVFREDKLNWQQVDYLRSKGYAIGIPKEIYDVTEMEVIL